MKQAFVGLFVALLTSLAACSSSPKPQVHSYYTESQFSKLTYCFGMTDTVMYVAREKLKQRPSVQLIDYYEPRPNAKLNIDIVKKVYADHFTSAWDYTLQTFDNCAQHFAGVPEARVGLSSDCEQQTLIADVAYTYRKYNYPRREVYKRFSSLKGKMPDKIVDMVYDSGKNRAQLKLDIWNACMARAQHE